VSCRHQRALMIVLPHPAVRDRSLGGIRLDGVTNAKVSGYLGGALRAAYRLHMTSS